MKLFLIAMMFVAPSFAFADEMKSHPNCSLIADCNEDDDDQGMTPWACAATNSRGEVYKAFLNWPFPEYVQRKAMKACVAASSNPQSCRALGCQKIH